MMDQNNISGFRKPIAYKVGGVYGGLFIYYGIILPFWALWLAKVGMRPGEIGFLIGLPYFLKLISSPFIAQLCDKWGQVRRTMMFLLAMGILFFCGYLFFDRFLSFVFITVFFSMSLTGFVPLLESYAVRVCDRHDLQYGRVRSVGSIVFILTSVLFGKYLDHYGYDNFLYFCIGSFIVTFITVWLLPKDAQKAMPAENAPIMKFGEPLKFLLTSREFVMFLVVVSLIQMSHGLIYVMGSIYWEKQGLDNQTIGILWGIGVFSEVLIFIFCGRIIALFRPMYVLAFIGFFGVLRWIILGSTIALSWLIFAQAIHGLTYAAAHLVAMFYLSSRVPDKYFMTAQSLYSSIPMGLSLGSVMLLSGALYDMMGGQAYYVMAALCLIVLMMAQFVRRVENTTRS